MNDALYKICCFLAQPAFFYCVCIFSLLFLIFCFITLQILLFMALKCYYWIVFCFSGDLCSDFCDFAYFRCEKYEMQFFRLVKSQVKYTKCRLKILCFYEKYVEFVKTWNSKKSIQSLFFLFFCVIFMRSRTRKIKILASQIDFYTVF